MSDRETLALLDRFVAAWNRHDADALLDCMTDDGTFYASAGSSPGGTRSDGLAALRKSFSAVWETFPDAHWGNANHFLAGDRACSEWTFTGTRSDGTKVEVRGCDLFLIRGGKIAVKDSFRKQIA
jgi:ketosteroid isomerase-like protein